MIYLTYSDPLTGVYESQVIDVCNYINRSFDQKIRLVSLISIKGFWKSRKAIKSLSKNAIVLPMFPTIMLWKLNIITLIFTILFTGDKGIIARGVLACNLALFSRNIGLIQKVCYDGRAAVTAEYEEYDVTPYRSFLSIIKKTEKNSVLKSNYRIAVSNNLIDYWNKKFGYTSNHHVIIPSTVNSTWKQEPLSRVKRLELKKKLGISTEKVVLVYSGSTAGWQSFDLMRRFVSEILENQSNTQFLLLSQSSPKINDFHKRFEQNFVEKWIGHNQVEEYLSVCDYGILLREENTTNHVASPVKFAEYLSVGLNVLVSKNIGDISRFVEANNCGLVIDQGIKVEIEPIDDKIRKTNSDLAKKFFTKEAHFLKYKILIEYLSSKE